MRAKELIDFMTAEGFRVFPDPNYLPDVKESQLPALFVFGTGGFESHKYLPIDRPTFQVLIKGKSYKDNTANLDLAEQEARRVIGFLDKKFNYTIGNSFIYESIAMQSAPIPLGVDEHSRPTFSTNFRFRLREG